MVTKGTAILTVAVTVLSGCTGPITHTNLGEGVPNAHIYFELLTSDFAGGGHLGVSTESTCKKSINVSDYVRVSDFRKGHNLQDDVDNFDASIPAGKELQLYGRVLAPHANCNDRVIFTPEVGVNYSVTFAYKLPGCELKVYRMNDKGAKDNVAVKHCR
jgi:uncharacterized protein YceK